MKKLINICGVIVAAGLCLAAEPDEFLKKQRAAYLAKIEKADKSVEDAEKQREKDVLAATKAYIEDLEKVKVYWTKKGKLEKALEFKKQIADLQELVDEGKTIEAGPVAESGPVAKSIYLSDLKELDVKVGYGSFGKKGSLGYADKKIIVIGRLSKNGLSMHPPSNGSSRVSYALDGKYRWFQARPALNDTSKGTITPVTFKVIGDGKVLWTSKPTRKRGHLKMLKLDINGVQKLQLEVSCPGRFDHAHAVWVDPLVSE